MWLALAVTENRQKSTVDYSDLSVSFFGDVHLAETGGQSQLQQHGSHPLHLRHTLRGVGRYFEDSPKLEDGILL
jgi:hypothetical protein